MNDIEDEFERRVRYKLVLYNRTGKSERTMFILFLCRICQARVFFLQL
jgi:hypothetical protein